MVRRATLGKDLVCLEKECLRLRLMSKWMSMAASLRAHSHCEMALLTQASGWTGAAMASAHSCGLTAVGTRVSGATIRRMGRAS